MNRNFESVLFKIQYIVSNLCNDEILQSKWLSELAWFPKFEETKHIEYWNLAPEAIMSMRWRKLGIVLESCLSSQCSDWEQRIVDIFLANDTGDDLPDITDVCPEYDYAENCYDEDEYDYDMEEERQLARQEKAASRNDDRRHRRK